MVATTSVGRVRFVSVRHARGSRRIAMLDPETLRTYTRLVAEIAARVEAGLSDRVVANRVTTCTVEPPALHLRPWRTERDAFAARLSELAGAGGVLTFADVRRCYASISPSTVGAELRRLGVGTAVAIEAFLRGLEPEGVRGLPVGPDPSAVLANAVLGRADLALERAGVAHVRWVDDVVLSSSDPRGALRVLRGALEEIGLRLNERKTRVVLDGSSADLGLGSPTHVRPFRLAGETARG
jgi:Reverse transcriptase (RNA-dependent DNA polymerase)